MSDASGSAQCARSAASELATILQRITCAECLSRPFPHLTGYTPSPWACATVAKGWKRAHTNALANPITTGGLARLDGFIFEHVLEQCDGETVCALRCTCRGMHDLVRMSAAAARAQVERRIQIDDADLRLERAWQQTRSRRVTYVDSYDEGYGSP